MQKVYSFFTIIIAAFLFTSCEKEINIDLNSAAKKYVIEGTVTNKAGGCMVKISQTKNFSEDNSFVGSTGAAVSIISNGSTVLLSETSPGIYTNDSLTGTSGNTYSMKVVINGEAFTATSTMPAIVPMDSLYIQNENVFGSIARLPTVQYLDPVAEQNYYRFIIKVNNIKVKQTYVWDDQWTNGNVNTTNLFVQPQGNADEGVKANDRVDVEMLTIDEAVHKYFFSLQSSATEESNSASPANPISNIQGGALGYFSAQTTQAKWVFAN